VRRLHREQSKHLAETARLIAVAQFSVFGYASVTDEQYLLAILSIVIFVELETVAVLLLGDS